jgi:hypothetical protein
MNNLTINALRHPKEPKSPTIRSFNRSVLMVVIASAIILFAAAMSRSFFDGRMASPITHDDVNYFITGIRRLLILRRDGVTALLFHFFHFTEHSPFLTYQATFAYLLFGVTDWAPYISNIFLLLLFLGVAAFLVRDYPLVTIAACMASLIALPMSSNIIIEFSPEIVCSLFTAIGAVLMTRLPLIGAPFGARFRAGLCFGLAFFSHPVASPFTLIALLATIGWMLIRDIVFTGAVKSLAIGIWQSLANLCFSLWLPILYLFSEYQIYWDYFDRNILNPTTRWAWEDRGVPLMQHLDFYLFGPGGQYMFGRYRLWECGLIIVVGLATAWLRKDRSMVLRQAELCLLAAVFWAVPTLAPVQNGEYASCFGFTVAFLIVLGLGSIFRSSGGKLGGIVLSAIAAIILVSDVSHEPVPNTPQTVADREFAFSATNRFEAVLFGNATHYHGTKVYMTNVGAYAPNILLYYMLKTDPELDWEADSGFLLGDPREQIEVIKRTRPDFVIAGQHDNGLTYSQWARSAEDPVLAAMLEDSNYFPIDRFYGPHGRTVTVFQLGGKYAGWHAVWGISDPARDPDAPRASSGGVAYLQTYAPRATTAQLHLECAGAPGTKVSVFLNQRKLAELTFSSDRKSSQLDQEINLSKDTNDIVLQYPSTDSLTVSKLLIIPEIAQ